MTSYAAFLGHQPHLSIAELSATIPDLAIRRIVHGYTKGSSRTVIIFDSALTLDPAYLSTLGGTVSIAQGVPAAIHTDAVPKLMQSDVANVRGKVTFALRTMGMEPKAVRDLYRRCKEQLRKAGRPSRYVGTDREPAPAILLHDAGLITGKHGRELTVIMDKSNDEEFLWIGRTVAAQDIEAYVKRDMKKPVRDTTVGLLPPKLAQIMLNLGAWLTGRTAVKEETRRRSSLVIFDPFCGTGVIPLEALLRGFPILASDKSQKAVTGCEKNLEWIRKEEKIFKKDVPSTVWKQDATRPFELKTKPDVIVTETTLGPPLSGRPTQKDVQAWKRENEETQRGFLQAVAQSLPGTPIVCTWPVWYLRKDHAYLEKAWDAVREAGYEAVLPPNTELGENRRMSILYRRPDQFVAREIVMLRPRKM
ncbi:MAG: hypothetical protein Greene041619_368 [Candidatus Peregrinibacteria bacterium Greene0416_19]|nr:MAG: hypothetical protein Greene041619_368 [Candidatus Peregrinibacteria bacterium Greene0416_19]